ncbi:MAG: aquaporin [Muribaculaceae bacterium]|nr:aquaporin [Muribaculaceae bacterium]
MKKLLAEGIGTMFLVILACGSAVLAGPKIGVLGVGLCFGLVLLCLCYAIGGTSGCHVNPAVWHGAPWPRRKPRLNNVALRAHTPLCPDLQMQIPGCFFA